MSPRGSQYKNYRPGINTVNEGMYVSVCVCVCVSVAVITHQKINLAAWNIGSSSSMITKRVIPNMIKTGPRDMTSCTNGYIQVCSERNVMLQHDVQKRKQ